MGRGADRRASVVRGRVDRGAYAIIGPAPADVRDLAIDVFIRREKFLPEKCGGCHYHAGLAISALWNTNILPSFLYKLVAIGRKPLNRGYFVAFDFGCEHEAGAHQTSI